MTRTFTSIFANAIIGWGIITGFANCATWCQAQSVVAVSIDEIREALAFFESELLCQPSLYFEYTQNREYEEGTSLDTPTRIHFVNAKKGDMYLSIRTCLDEREPKAWYSWKGGVSVNRHANGLTIYPQPDLALREQAMYAYGIFFDYFRGLTLSNQTLIDAVGARSFSAANRVALPRSIENSKVTVTIRPELEVIDGTSCVVLENGDRDVLWLDPKRRYFCIRRVRKGDKGQHLSEFVNRDLKSRGKGIWLPDRQEISFFRQDVDGRQVVSRKFVNQITKISFDELPDEYFDVPIPEQRGFVIDEIRKVDYPIHAQAATHEDILSQALKRAQASSGSRHWLRPSWLSWIVLLSALAIASVLTWQRLIRRRLSS